MYLFKKTVCILIAGRAFTGKSTTARFMKKYLDSIKVSSVIGSFATGVKQTATFMGWDGKKDEKGRQLLIDIGASGRRYDPDIWCKTTFKYIIPVTEGWPLDVVLIDDNRFPNEIDYVRKDWTYQTYTVRVVAPNREGLKGIPQYNDISETSLTNDMQYDFYIDNTGNLDELDGIVKVVIQDIIDKAEKI
jgi:hypothetical protein